MNFNIKQLEAINSTANVTVVIAGAGSGKTAVLTTRIKKLINDGMPPFNILAITFTNKAAKEMKERVNEGLNMRSSGANIMTFHAMSLKIIRENVSYLKNYKENFQIIDDDDKKRIVKNILKDHLLEDEFKVGEITYAIGYSKSRALTYNNVKNLIPINMLSIYEAYKQYLHENNALDFDDILLLCYDLLKIKEVREHYQKLFKDISVDEFQDTSLLQGEILNKLKCEDNTLFIVGDIDQSIYTWRGAIVENLLEISEQYENVKIIKLEQNYRSKANILNAANTLIKNNKKRIKKDLWTEAEEGKEIEYYSLRTNFDEATKIIGEINSLTNYGVSYDKFAILYRYNYQSRKIEESLMKNKIPYILYGGIRFYQRLEIKDIIAYLRIFINNDDNISMLRIINVPKRKVGDKTTDKLRKIAEEENLSLFEVIQKQNSKNLQNLIRIINTYSYITKTKSTTKFSEGFDKFLKDLAYEDYLLTQYDKFNVEDRMNNIQEFKNSLIQELENSENLQNYINEISLYDKEDEIDSDAVILSTIHGAKGLEFDNVFLIGMIDGKFPKEAAFFNDDEMEEERRLAYVGITRAKKKLTITSYLYDFKYELQEPSRFIDEMGISQKIDDFDDFIF